MKALVSATSKMTSRSVIASVLVMLCLWWTINSFVQLAILGQGWPALITSVVLLVLSTKLLPHDNFFRTFLRDLWHKA